MTKIQVNSSGKAYTTGNNKVLAAIVGTPEWGDITGTLSDQTDLQTALNAKITGNTAITGATKCKITYDSKGLVTAGADLQASDIPDISATYQTKLTSGTNIKTINSTSLLGSGDIAITGLPSQTSQSGKFLTTNGTTASWATVDALPSQSSQSGKFLTTNGTTASWADIPTEIPSQTSQSGKFLTTNGTTASWASIPEELPSQSGQSGKFLTTNGSAVSWATVDALPSQTGQSGKVLTTNGSAVSWENFPTVNQTYSGTSSNAQSGVAVKSAIDAAIASVYKPEGSIAFANRPALSSSIEGYVYNITDSFTTTSDFVEGAGKTYPAGTNIVCINTSGSTYKWDVLAGFVDLSGYQTLIDSTHKLSADLVDDTSTTHKFVTASDKTTWSGKQDALVSGTNIKTINSTSLLGSGDIAITGLPSQTSQSGKFLTTNGTTASWATVDALQNTATGTRSLTILGTASSSNNAMNIGSGSSASAPGVAVGNDSSISGKNWSSVFGVGATASNAQCGVAIGSYAKVTADYAIQIGGALNTTSSVNQTANTLSVYNGNGNYRLLESNGTIPQARLASGGTNGQVLMTNGTTASWASIPEELPSQTGNSGKYLTTNGTTASWATVLSTITYTPTTETLEFI